MADDYVLVLTTLPAEGDEAPRIARRLVEDRVVACINILPTMISIYRWDGEVQEEAERQVVMKTARRQVPALWERLRDLHPYDVPEFVVVPIVDGSDAYLKWIADATSQEPA